MKFMKSLIWFGVWCAIAFPLELLRILLVKNGLYLGAIPTYLFYGLLFAVATPAANRARDKWASNHFKKKADEAGMTPFEYAMKDIPKMFRLEIENRLERNDGLSGYLNMCVKEKVITKEQERIILDAAKK